jgi:uncharacterized membrane protein YeaQ/YmgE (transglycosylase-associated protein family)
MSDVFTWIIVGGIAGALGKLISPGDDGGGWILTIILGIVGAIVGGFISSVLGLGGVTGFNIGSLLVATGGAVLVLFIYKKFIA